MRAYGKVEGVAPGAPTYVPTDLQRT